jgi:hypothetical protein
MENKIPIQIVETYVVANAVGLVGTVLDGVVALGDTVVVFCAADHFEFLKGV